MNDDIRYTFNLLCRITQQENISNLSQEYSLFYNLKKLIKQDLDYLLLDDTPEDISSILYNFNYELNRFEEFLAFPYFSNKNIVGIGGKFSSGKSMLINSLLSEKILPTSTTPTTSIPTLIGKGEKDKVAVLNIFRRLIEIDKSALKVLKHVNYEEEEYLFSHLLKHIFVMKEDFKFENIVLLDTPGISSEDEKISSELTDEKRALAELNNSDYVIWCVDSEQGTLQKDEIRILKEIDKRIEKVILLTKIDKKYGKDKEKVYNKVKELLEKNGILVENILTYSARKLDDEMRENLMQVLRKWDSKSKKVYFGRNFKKLFVKILDYYVKEQDREKLKLNRINKSLSLIDESEIIDELGIIERETRERLKRLKEKEAKGKELEGKFFKEIRDIGKIKGIEIPEPGELELLEYEVDFLKELINFISKKGIKKQDYGRIIAEINNIQTDFLKETISDFRLNIPNNNILIDKNYNFRLKLEDINAFNN